MHKLLAVEINQITSYFMDLREQEHAKNLFMFSSYLSIPKSININSTYLRVTQYTANALRQTSATKGHSGHHDEV